MAYQNTFYINEVPVTCTGSGSHDWITADFMIQVNANAANTAYDINVYARIDSGGRMNWTGDGDIRVTCNGITKSAQVTLAMYSSGTTAWDGPVTFSFGAPGTVALNMNFDLDLTRTTGTNGRPGPTHNSDGGNLQHFYYNNYIITVGDGGVPPLIVPPTISGLTNTNKYNSDNGISASTNSISVSWTETGTVTNRYYRVNSGSWVTISSPSVTIPNLTAGTSYTIEVASSNSAGDSNYLSTTIRTRHNAPVITVTVTSRQLDSLTFSWTSDKPLASLQYRKSTEVTWIDSGTYGTSGTITISRIAPNIVYSAYFKGVSTAVYDSLDSNNAIVTTSTLDMARITSIGDCIFGNSITINVSKAVSNTTKLKIWTTGNSLKPEFEIDVVNGANTFTPTQEQLDKMYKCFSTENSITIYFSLTTTGQWSNWTDDQQSNTLQLTGIAKTSHIGVNNTPKRAQVWIGVNGVPRRAIVWVGDANNKPRRCI